MTPWFTPCCGLDVLLVAPAVPEVLPAELGFALPPALAGAALLVFPLEAVLPLDAGALLVPFAAGAGALPLLAGAGAPDVPALLLGVAVPELLLGADEYD
jgi:hypothetical protein